VKGELGKGRRFVGETREETREDEKREHAHSKTLDAISRATDQPASGSAEIFVKDGC